MGVMRFQIHPPDIAQPWSDWSLGYISGVDGRIFATKVERDGNFLACKRSQNDSGKFSVPWPVAGFGRPVVTTASLLEREQPYLLPLELARGKLSDLRDQAAAWEMNRMAIPDAYRSLQSDAFRLFARASSSQTNHSETCNLANQAIRMAFEATEVLLGAYTIQRMTSIRKTSRHAPGLLGCMLDTYSTSPAGQDVLRNSFDTAGVTFDWRRIEPCEGQYDWTEVDQLVQFCADQRKIVRGGPLLQLSENGLPDWLAPWKSDVLNLPSFVCDFVDTVIGRYAGLIRIWEVSAAGNIGGALGLSEEHRLALVARTLEAAIKKDADSQFFIRIEQPWGEYQREGRHRLSPFQFVDAIIRSSLGLTGVTLDVNVGYAPNGCYARDLLSISRLIDLWSLLGIQLHVNLACPSAAGVDPLADPGVQVDANWKGPWTPDIQSDWFEEVVPLLLAKPAVTGVFLQQFSDAVPHRFPFAGAISADGSPKPVLDAFRRQRGGLAMG